MKPKYKLILGITLIVAVASLLIYQSYALWVDNHIGQENIVEVGCFEINYEELTSSVKLRNTYPVNDQKGMSGDAYTFKITNNCTIDSSYNITLNTFTTNGIKANQMKYAIYQEGEEKPSIGTLLSTSSINEDKEELGISNLDESYVLASGKLTGAEEAGQEGESVTYNLHLWIDENVGNEVMKQTFEASVNVVNAGTKIVTPLITDKVKGIVADADESSTEVIDRGTIGTCTNTLAYDGTVDNNLRYVGANPCNYVDFNDEKWRIIGVMNNVDDGTGNKETRLKIIRDEFIGKYTMDSKGSGVGSSNNIRGSSDWTDSQLMMLLNTSTGYRLKDGYTKEGNVIKDDKGNIVYQEGCAPASISSGDSSYKCNEANFTMNEKATNLIGEAVWNLGTSSNYGSESARGWYTSERGTKVYGKYDSTWTGNVSLMYFSDFGYATSGGSTTNRSTCLDTVMFEWNKDAVTDCRNNDWLFHANAQKVLNHYVTTPDRTMFLATAGQVYLGYITMASDIYPTVYLKSNVIVTDGDGTENNPYQLKIK